MYKDSPLETILKGAMAGLIGTVAITAAMNHGPELMQKMGISLPRRPDPPEANLAPESGQPTERLADRISSGVLQQPLDVETRKTAGHIIHWGYGATWGILYGILESSFHLPSLVHGIIFGSTVGIVSATALPAMGLTADAEDSPAPVNVMQMADHVIYGLITALVFRLLSRDANRLS